MLWLNPSNCSALSDGDCNDMNSSIYPSATETCDSIDEDCDGIADNNPIDPLTWYLDNDSDLRGDPNTLFWLVQCPLDMSLTIWIVMTMNH